MAQRSTWEGFLRLSMISVPVKAFSTTGTRDKFSFHQLHAKCKSRIRYQKVCPIHGEVPNEEIVPGYEYARDEYVVIDPKELARLKQGGERSVLIDVFVDPEAIDPVYYGERSYYLTPDGRSGEKPFAVLHRAMTTAGRYGVGTILLSGREHAVLVRPLGRLLAVTLLHFADAVRTPSAYEAEVPDAEVSTEELRLARSLIEAATPEHFDFRKYKDEYAGKVMALIEAKAGRRKGTAPKAAEEPPVILNLMDALRQSLVEVKKPAPRRKQAGRHGRNARSRPGGRRNRAHRTA
jgi:DNA end-binding protein Ku